MSVIGIDIGNENCYIAVARAGGIETIANDYSQRATPTYVSFGEKTRFLGVAAKNKQVTDFKNTIFSFKRLLGRKFNDPVIQHELEYLPYDLCALPNGDIGVKVSYLCENTIFTIPQVMGMMLTKIKEIAENALKIKVQDCVISVPMYYADAERRALLNAAEIAGLNPLKLLNEPTAVALAYGFYLQDLPEDKPKNVVFVDFGNSCLQVTACAFTKGKLKILASVWCHDIGGRDFDNVLVKHFAKDFGTRYKLNVMANGRAVIRLVQESEKLKKQMSASSLELPINIECFMNDKDVSGRMKREEFENLSDFLLKGVESTLQRLLQESNLKLDDIDSVQIVGGATRIPAVKLLVQKIFGKEPSTTLNQDEAVARGCALQCAMLSPTFKVRDFSITDIQPYPINLSWNTAKNEDQLEVFPKFHQVPFSKVLTFFRMEPFTLDAYYTGTDTSYGESKIGAFTIQNVTPNPEGESRKVKVKARVNVHGIFSICSASMTERQTVTINSQANDAPDTNKVNNEAQQNTEESMDTENKTPSPNGEVNNIDADKSNESKEESEKKNGEKVKTVLKSIDLPILAVVKELSRHELNELFEKENKMIMQDKMEKEKVDAKNAVEEYVYEMRGKLSDEYEKFITDIDRDVFRQLLDNTENWLYDEGEDQQKSVYVQKLNEMKKTGDNVIYRYLEWQRRPSALMDFGLILQFVQIALESYKAKENYTHIDEEEMKKVHQMWEDKHKWLGSFHGRCSALKEYEDPPISTESIRQELKVFKNSVMPILEKPKPKVEPPPADAAGDGAQNMATDSEMVDGNAANERVPNAETAPPNSQPDQMETN